MISDVLQVAATELGWSFGDLKAYVLDVCLLGDENGKSSVGVDPVRSEGTEILLVD